MKNTLFSKLMAWTLIFTLLMGIVPINAVGEDYGNGGKSSGREEATVYTDYFDDVEYYYNNPDDGITDGGSGESDETDDADGVGAADGEDENDQETEGYEVESYTYTMFSMPFTPFGGDSGGTYVWDGDATSEDLTGVTEVILKNGATGTLNLVEQTVTMAVYESGIAGGDIVADSTVETIIFTGKPVSGIANLEYSGSGTLKLSREAEGDSSHTGGFSINKINIKKSDASLILNSGSKDSGYSMFSIGSISGDLDTLELSGTDSLSIGSMGIDGGIFNGIEDAIDTIKITGGGTNIYSPQNKSADTEPTKDVIPSVKNLIINGGSLTVSGGNNNANDNYQITTESGSGIILEDGGVISVTNGSLSASGSDGGYGGNPGGLALKTKGKATINVDNGSIELKDNPHGGHPLYLGGEVKVELKNKAGFILDNFYDNSTVTGDGSLEISLSKNSMAKLIGGSASQAIGKEITVNFKETGEGAYNPPVYESEPYSYAPTLIVRHGSSFAGEISPITIKRGVEGVFKYGSGDYEAVEGQSFESEEFQVIPKAKGVKGELYLEPSGAIDVQLTKAEQSGGISGRKDTEGITVTLDKIINNLPPFSVVYDTGKTINTGNPQKQSNGYDWYIPISNLPQDIAVDTNVTVTIENSNYYSFDDHNTQNVTICKRGTERTFTLTQIGGKNGLEDTTGILVTFNEPTVLTQGQITLDGAAIASLTDNNDANEATWLINLKDVTKGNGDRIKVTIADKEPNGYLVEGPKEVTIFRSTDTALTFTVKQQGGISGDKNSTGILLTFEDPYGPISVSELTKEKIELTDANGINIEKVETVEGTNNSAFKWLVKISGNIPDNEHQIGVKINDWDGSNTHYTLSPNTANVKLYKDIRQGVTFTVKQLGGVSGEDSQPRARTRAIELTFNHPVENLTSNRINLTGATAGTLTKASEDGKVWNLSISGISVANKKLIRIKIDSWPGYRVDNAEVSVEVYTANAISYSLSQVGGSSRTGTTTGLLVKFDEGLTESFTKDNYDVFLRGKEITVADAVYYEDINDKSTWQIKLPTDIEWEDNDTVTVILKGDPGEVGSNIVVGGRDILGYYKTQSTRIYKDYQTYIKISEIKQVGGAEEELESGEMFGVKSTDYIELSFAYESGPGVTKGDPYEENVFSQKSIIVDGAVMDKAAWVDNKVRIYLNPTSYNSGDEIKITVENPAKAVIDNPERKVKVYKDMRTVTDFKLSTGSEISGGDTTKLYITFTTPMPDLQYGDIEFTKGKDDDFTLSNFTLMTGTDNKVYMFSVEVNEEIGKDHTDRLRPYINIKADVKIDTDKYPKYYFMKDEATVTLRRDLRKHIDVYLEQLDGKDGIKDSKGIKLTIYNVPRDKEYLYSFNEYEIAFKSDNKRFERPYYDYRHYSDYNLTNLIVEFPFTDWFKGQFKNKETLGINLVSRRGDIVYNLVLPEGQKVKDEEIDEYGRKFTFAELYRDLGITNLGTRIDRVSPGGIYKDDKDKTLTLIGKFYPQDIKQLLLRKEGDDTSEQIIPVTYKVGMGDTTGLLSKLTVDLSGVEMLKEEGNYEIAFVTNILTSNYANLMVTDNRAFSTENFGILAVTQRADKQFALEMFKNEGEMAAMKAKGKTLLTFKGRVKSEGYGSYKVFSDSTMNKALEYRGGENDYIAIETQFDGRIIVSAEKGSLRWNGIPMAVDFEIELDPNKAYINKRGETGETVLLSTGYTDSFDIYFMQAGIDKYRIYEDQFSIGGHLILGNSIPFVAENLQAGAELHEMILQDGFKELPPTHAQAWIDFSPERWLGDFVGGNGKFNFEINSLPETKVKFVSLEGELEINDVIYISGEFVFTWGNTKDGRTLFIPDSLKFFIRSDAEGAGIPLVPPVIVAYITGVGGGIEGLQTTAYKDFNYIPPFKLSLKGAIKDATGMLIDVKEATITIGPSEFSAYVDEMKVLKLITFKKVGLATGLRDVEDAPPDFYFTFGGSVSFEKGPVEASASIEAGLELYGKKMEEALIAYLNQPSQSGSKQGFKKPNKETIDKLFEVVDFWGSATAKGKFEWECFKVEGKGHVGVNKSKISGRLTGEVGKWTPSIGFTWYYGGKFTHDIQLWSVEEIGDDRIILGYDEDGGLIVATNLINKGSFGPTIAQGSMRLMADNGLSRTEVPGMEKGYVVGITAHEKHDKIYIYKDGSDDVYEELTNIDWLDTTESFIEEGYGKYTTAYLIPEGGNYVFEAEGPIDCHVTEILPIPEFTDLSVDADKKEVTWSLNDIAMDKIDDLSVRLTLHDAETGKMIQTLTEAEGTEEIWLPDPDEEGKWKKFDAPLTKVKANDGKYTYSLGGSLPTGNYFIRGALLETVEEPELGITSDSTLDIMDTASFEYTNAFAPGEVQNVTVDYIGKGAIKITWNEVSDADGYLVTILNKDGIPVSSLTDVDVSKKGEKEKIKTETIIQGGASIFEDEAGVLKEVGLRFGENYQASVKAYKNKEVGFSAFAHNEDIPTSNIPIYGKAGLKDFTIDEPQIPEFTITVDGKEKQSDEDASYYVINKTVATIEVSVDKEVNKIDVYKVNGTEVEIQTITGNAGQFTYDFKQDGVYKLRFDTETDNEEASQFITVEVDTTPPYLLVDADSRVAVNGKININGMVEKGAKVTDNGAPVAVEDGSFTITGTTEDAIVSKYLVAGDAAGNVTELYFDILYKSDTDDKDKDSDRDDRKKSKETAKTTGAEKDKAKGEIVAVGKLQITLPEGGEVVTNKDGSAKLTTGGSIEIGEKADMKLPKGTVIDKDNNIHIPQGEEATVILYAGLTLKVKGGTTIILDDKAPLGYRIVADRTFEDVEKGSWYEDDIAFAYAHNLFAGTGDSTFSPDMPMTRGMLVTVLGRMAGADTNSFGQSTFDDVERDKYYTAFAEWAKQSGIVSGIGDNKFAPDAPVTRQDLAVVLYNYMKFADMDLAGFREYMEFQDQGDISDYAAAAVKTYYEGAVLNGKPGDVFDPKGNASRGELAAILYRFLGTIE